MLAWQMDTVDAVLARAPVTLHWLSATETARLAGLAPGVRRRQFLAGRWLLRELLARGTAVPDPAAWWLDGAPGRAPALGPGAPAAPGCPTLSLSHSGDWVAAAAGPGPLGIDIEAWPPRRARDAAALLDAICTPPERSLWVAGPAEALAWRLHVCWTLKEAAAKALGRSALPGPLQALRCRPPAGSEPPNAWSGQGSGWVAGLYQSPSAAQGGPGPAGWQAWRVDDIPAVVV